MRVSVRDPRDARLDGINASNAAVLRAVRLFMPAGAEAGRPWSTEPGGTMAEGGLQQQTLPGLNEGLEELSRRAGAHGMRLRELADVLTGSEPSPELQPDGLSTGPLLARGYALVAEVNARLTDAEHELERLERVIDSARVTSPSTPRR